MFCSVWHFLSIFNHHREFGVGVGGSQQDELSAVALRSIRAVLHFCLGNPHSWRGITVSAAVRQSDGWQIFCTANIGFIKSLSTKLLLLFLSSSVYLVQPSRKAALMYALSESNMPAAVPSDCVSLHSSLIFRVILGRVCSDYSSGRVNNQPWARIHLWGTSAGNNTKVDAPGTQHLIKNLSSFLSVVVHANKTDWIENKWWRRSFPVLLLGLWMIESVQVRKTASNDSPDVFFGSKKRGSGGVLEALLSPLQKRISLKVVANRNKRKWSCSGINWYLLWGSIVHLKAAVIGLSWPLCVQRHSPQQQMFAEEK